MNGINYYMFVGGTNWHNSGLFGSNHDWQAPIGRDGNYRHSYHYIARLGKTLHALGESLVCSRLRSDVTIGWDPDVYMTEYRVDATQSMHDRLKYLRETALFGLGRSLSLNHISYSALDISQAILDPIQHPILMIIGMPWMNRDVQQRCANYVTSGGHLVLLNEVPTFDFFGNPCTILSDALGLAYKGVEYGSLITYEEIEGVNTSELHLYDHEEGWITSEKSGYHAAFTKKLNHGKLSMIGVLMHNERLFKDELWGRWFKRIGIHSPFQTSERIHISERIHRSTRYLSVLNLDEVRKSLTITYHEQPLFDGHPLIIQARQGLLLPMNLSLSSKVSLVYTTVELIDQLPHQFSVDVSAKHAVICLSGVHVVNASHSITQHPTADGVLIFLNQLDEQSVTITFGELT